MKNAKLFKSFGRRVSQVRKAKGLSQAALGEKIGKSLNTVSNIERGLNPTGLDTIAAIAVSLGVPVQELFEPDPTYALRSEQQAEVAKILEMLQDCDPEVLREVRALIGSALNIKRRSKAKRRAR